MVDVLVEVSQQEDPSSRTEYGMEIRGDDSRVEAVRMELPDSFVAPDDSSMVSMQVDCQASPKPYYIDSSMQSPEVTISTIVGGLNSVNKVASLSSNHSEQEAKVVVPESDQPLSDVEVVVLNKNIVQDEFEETSNAARSANKHKESPRLSGISEVVPSATSKSKEIVVGPEAALCDCAVQNEFQNSPTTIEDSDSSKRCGLLETDPCEFAIGDCKMNPDGIRETLSVTLKKDSSLKVEELCTYPSPFIAEEPSLRERIAAGSTEEPICSTWIQSGASNF